MEYTYIANFVGTNFYNYLKNNEETLNGVINLLIDCFKQDLDNYKIAEKYRKSYMITYLKELNNNQIFVYVINKEIVGIAISEIIDSICVIESFCILRKYRRRKLGSLILNHIIKNIDYVSKFKLEVLVDNTIAINFYKKHDFKLISTETDEKYNLKYHVMTLTNKNKKINNREIKAKRSKKRKEKIRFHSF